MSIKRFKFLKVYERNKIKKNIEDIFIQYITRALLLVHVVSDKYLS